jgi:hypothetical protein
MLETMLVEDPLHLSQWHVPSKLMVARDCASIELALKFKLFMRGRRGLVSFGS